MSSVGVKWELLRYVYWELNVCNGLSLRHSEKGQTMSSIMLHHVIMYYWKFYISCRSLTACFVFYRLQWWIWTSRRSGYSICVLSQGLQPDTVHPGYDFLWFASNKEYLVPQIHNMNNWFIWKPSYLWSCDYPLANLIPSYKAWTSHETSLFLCLIAYFASEHFPVKRFKILPGVSLILKCLNNKI